MLDLLPQILVYMSCTFLLGVALGWILWRFGGSRQLNSPSSEVDFWRRRFEQFQLEREGDLNKIEALKKDKEKLKARIANMDS